tara:strand:- start:1161 stop:1400 length:240 start_codon:yes stop_codon:yes gene_type:complete
MFNQESLPKVFTYKFMQFNEIEACDFFLKENKPELKKSIESQFPVETIHTSMMMCMTTDEINRLTNQIQESKWQEQKHI